ELIATCLRLGATVTEIPVRWSDMAGSTFSVRRHSSAVFRDLAAIWLRGRVGHGFQPGTPELVPLAVPPQHRPDLGRDPRRDLVTAGATTA
ncbi:MAG TPA: hypothetical protein VFQ68_44645, partial [Streptosporangiaceae bacterium]|nr:hypothetical protein [Streptosporangiaceae bacterium]